MGGYVPTVLLPAPPASPIAHEHRVTRKPGLEASPQPPLAPLPPLPPTTTHPATACFKPRSESSRADGPREWGLGRVGVEVSGVSGSRGERLALGIGGRGKWRRARQTTLAGQIQTVCCRLGTPVLETVKGHRVQKHAILGFMVLPYFYYEAASYIPMDRCFLPVVVI